MSVKGENIKKRIKRCEPMICIDSKGAPRSKIYEMAKRHNYTVRELKFSDGCEAQGTAKNCHGYKFT